MDLTFPGASATEVSAGFFQALVTTGLALLFVVLLVRERKAHFAYWTLAWGMYSFRLACILSFVLTTNRGWLYWHQVATGWTALALLWAALVFALQVRWRHSYGLLILFPPLWSYIAIYRLDNFMAAALPAVLFLSLATLWTGLVFLRYAQIVRSVAAAILGGILLLWGIHDLDYPFLRAFGAWNPWGYYLDTLFELGVAFSLLLVILEDQRRGLTLFSVVAGDLQESARGGEVLASLVERPLTLPGVLGSAIYRWDGEEWILARAAGIARAWAEAPGETGVETALRRAREDRAPHLLREGSVLGAAPGEYSYALAIPISRRGEFAGALVVVGYARDPLAALDQEFLEALGQQVGSAMETSSLYRRLQYRTVQLEKLAARMVALHEEERRRLSRELHDETAQVFAAVNLELGALREGVPQELAPRLDRARALVGEGIKGLRNLTRDLRPTLLDDLGLLPALRALVDQFGAGESLTVELDAPPALPPLDKDCELALFRALQEGLSNVGRHAGARRVEVRVAVLDDAIELSVRDDGRGIGGAGRGMPGENMGLTGMRERVGSLGGSVHLADHPEGGARLRVRMPYAAATTEVERDV